MHPDYTIRPTRHEDIPRLPAIEAAANTRFAALGWPGEGHVMDEDSHRAYGHAGRSWVAVEASGAPVGFAVASVTPEGGHLDEIDVHPDHGQRGIGRALVERVCDWARACGFPALTLTTERTIPWNAPFYASMGFVVVPPDQWTPAQRALFEHEAAPGFASGDRVLMRRDLCP